MRRFQVDDGTSRKFWEIEREGRRVTVRFGRLETKGQSQVKDLGSDRAAQAHVERMIAAKIKKGYVEKGQADASNPEVARPEVDDLITAQRGMKRYLRESSGASRVLVRHADDIEAAAEALRRFRHDLWTSDLFASLDGEFGDDVDGTPLRYTPSFASEVHVEAEGPEFWFDAQDILEAWPELADDLIEKLKERLREAGVQRAEIGKPRRSYAERAYVVEADWFSQSGKYLQPLDERWLPPNFPNSLPIPAKAPVAVAHEGHDGSWAHVAWRRRKANDEFADVLDRWREHGFVIEPLTTPPERPPDISWGWDLVHRAFTISGPEASGCVWIVFSRSSSATDLHALWYAWQSPPVRRRVALRLPRRRGS